MNFFPSNRIRIAVSVCAFLLAASEFVLSQSALQFRSERDTLKISGSTVLGTTVTIEAIFKFDRDQPIANIYVEDWVGQGSMGQKNFGVTSSGLTGFAAPNYLGQVMLAKEMSVSKGTWHHAAFVMDSSTERLYLDGVLVVSRASQNKDIWESTASCFLGYGWFGWISSFRISNVARYSGNSYTLPGLKLPSDSSTLLLYNFASVSGDTVYDESGNGRHGTLGASTIRAVDATAPVVVLMDSETRPLSRIQTVFVGDAGNAAAITGYGSVSDAFAIGKYEISIDQYAAFLNATARTNTNSFIEALWNPMMASNSNISGIGRSGTGSVENPFVYSVFANGSNASNRPVSYISWFDAARFCNWLHNGATNGADTESGAYTLNGATSGIVSKNTDAKWWIPGEDQWVKAAYYKGGGTNAGYWQYPTQSDASPGNVVGSASNQANYKRSGLHSITQSSVYSTTQNYLAPSGAYSGSASAYGTFDQGGNVWEWTDAVVDGVRRGFRGGCWEDSDPAYLQGTLRPSLDPSSESPQIGFRVAASLGVADSDNDGVNDFREVEDGTNPSDPNSLNPLSKGLVAYYPFNGTAHDRSGYSHVLSSSNTSFVADKLGRSSGAIYFDGSAFMRGDVRAFALESAETHTISAWVKTEDLRHSCMAGYVNAIDGSSSGSRGYQLMTSWPEGSGKYVFLQGQASSQGGWAYAKENGQNAGDGRWHHLVGVRRAGVAYIYLDGVLQAETTTLLPTFNETSRIVVGWDGFSPKAKATIDDVRIYNRSLSDAEIEKLYIVEAASLDSDNDGLTDAAEFLLEGLGFDKKFNNAADVLKLFNNPNNAFLYTSGQYDANRAAGQADVTSNPSAFNLFTQAQRDTFGQQQFFLGVNSVVGSLPPVKVSAPSSSVVRAGLGLSNLTGVVASNLPSGWQFDPATKEIFGTVPATNPVSALLVAQRGTNAPIPFMFNFGPLPKQSQTILPFRLTNNVPFGTVLTFTNTNSSAGLPVNFAVLSGPATINSNRATITGVGQVVVTASQAGNTTYAAAPTLTNTFTTVKANQTITFTLSSPVTFVSNGIIPLRATSSSSLPITYASANTNIMVISGTNAIMKGRGTNTITASQAGNINYNAASNVVRTIVVR